MKHFILASIVIGSIALYSSCHTSKKSMDGTSPAPNKKFVGNIERGSELFENQCTACHVMKPVEDFTMEQWSVIVPKMRVKVNQKFGEGTMSLDDTKSVLAYIGQQKSE